MISSLGLRTSAVTRPHRLEERCAPADAQGLIRTRIGSVSALCPFWQRKVYLGLICLRRYMDTVNHGQKARQRQMGESAATRPVSRSHEAAMLALLEEIVTKVGDVRQLLTETGGGFDSLFKTRKARLTKVTDSLHRRVIIDQLQGGRHVRFGRIRASAMTATLRRNKVDLLIDEINNVMEITSDSPIRISLDDVAPSLRNLLWLILIHVGQRITFEKIESHFNMCGVSSRSHHLRIYQYRRRLICLVGQQLGETMLRSSRKTPRRYFVPASGWSFIWVRESGADEESALCTGLGD